MKNASGKEIEKMFKNAWEDFKNYYDERARKYSKGLSEKETENEHWICWDEADLMLQLGRFFYQRLGGNSGIEVHFDKTFDEKNFEGYEFESKIKELEERVGKVKLDLIITDETNRGPFLLCAEAKCFRYYQWRQGVATVVIKRDIDRLVELKRLEIAEKTVFILFDDYYYLKEKDEDKKIQEILAGAPKDIVVLYHNSKAKIVTTPHT